MKISLQSKFVNIIGNASRMQEVYRLIGKVADSDSTILIYGESGTGKELIARAIHYKSSRSDRHLIPVNCGAIPEDILESELFGHEKGAFTGAMRRRIGRFELADKGTIFLDEIGDMSPALQVKILRVLQEQEFERVGGTETIKVNVRVIAATHRDLEKAVEENRFREDLFYRLNVIPVNLPPLRERKSDIPLLVNHFLDYFNQVKNRNVKYISPESIKFLSSYRWPGNVRELENLIERLVVLNDNDTIMPEDMPEKVLGVDRAGLPSGGLNPGDMVHGSTSSPDGRDTGTIAEVVRDTIRKSLDDIPGDGIHLKRVVEEFENRLIIEVLDRTNWVKSRAASLLGLNRTTLVEKMKKKGIYREG
ncbi:MAG: sigma-54 interaction domain-containing protein [Nitrospinota bacterium]